MKSTLSDFFLNKTTMEGYLTTGHGVIKFSSESDVDVLIILEASVLGRDTWARDTKPDIWLETGYPANLQSNCCSMFTKVHKL